MRVDKSVTPVVKPARKIPQAMEKKVKEELGSMVKKGVIVRETEPTEWVSQMVANRKKNGDVRIYLDPRDLNKALKRPHHPMRTADDVASKLGNAKVFSTLDAKARFWQIKLEKTVLSTYNVQYTIWEVQVSPHALRHQHSIRSVPASHGKTFCRISMRNQCRRHPHLGFY